MTDVIEVVPERRAAEVLVRCPGRSPLLLRPGTLLRVGRHPTNEVVITDPWVSRFHLVLAWEQGEPQPYVEDLRSANGVVVDRAPLVGRATVGCGTRVRLGRTTLFLEAPQEHAAGVDPSFFTPDAPVTLFSDVGPETHGVARNRVELRTLLLSLEAYRRTGTLSIEAGSGYGSLTFALGRVVDATIDGLKDTPALRAVLSLPRCAFLFSREVEPQECPLSISMRHFLGTLTTLGADAASVMPADPCADTPPAGVAATTTRPTGPAGGPGPGSTGVTLVPGRAPGSENCSPTDPPAAPSRPGPAPGPAATGTLGRLVARVVGWLRVA